ncbi:MAG: phosphoribosylaminoimidazolesuccinocarboxamide synthase [Lentisphaerae bacterium]|nr:phosphoribosylaminoimidazolesuccinocarboxamide synthase [Lentisphaerota bacterium]
MVSEKRIRQELACTLNETDFKGLGPRETGKVRDSYKQGDRRILIATDRISAFDCVLGTIPFKGQVLNQLAAFWFEQTKAIVPNHVIAVPDPNVMVVAECRQLPVEFIVRGYITGVTKTSLWHHYQQGVRNYCGNPIPDGLRKDQKLDTPILTPTTKLEKHDRPISRDEAIREGLLDAPTFDEAAAICFRLFDLGVRFAKTRGLILVDTKYEIGRLDGRLRVSDEIHTPDSSRYWFADTYDTLFAQGADQRKLDKEYVREWYAAQGFRGEGAPPAMPDEVRVEAAKRYIQAYELITGREFTVTDEPVAPRIAAALEAFR